MKKTYILDTNVILHDPQSIFKFEENDIGIPITVLEEIDTFKKSMDELGRNARYFSKVVDELRETGSLLEGVKVNSDGGKLRVFILSDKDYKTLPHDLDLAIADNRILAAAYLHKNSILVSKDTNMRLKADALGIPAETYENDAVEYDTLYTGVITTEEGYLPPLDVLSPNQFVQVKGVDGQVMSEFIFKNGELQHLREDLEAWGLTPRNAEQRFAMQLLLDDDIKLVTLVGKAGVGKTLEAIGCGLRKVTDEFVYRKLLVSRPVMPMGRDIGFLPGDIEEKLAPYMAPIVDNIEFLMNGYVPEPDPPIKKNSKKKVSSEKDEGLLSKGYQELVAAGIIDIEPLLYIRGRSIPKQFLIVDEAQNLTPHEVKTIITRSGEGTKIVLTGDPTQLDHPYLDASSNGLTYVVEKFKDQPIAGHVTLTQGERSELATLAAKIL